MTAMVEGVSNAVKQNASASCEHEDFEGHPLLRFQAAGHDLVD